MICSNKLTKIGACGHAGFTCELLNNTNHICLSHDHMITVDTYTIWFIPLLRCMKRHSLCKQDLILFANSYVQHLMVHIVLARVSYKLVMHSIVCVYSQSVTVVITLALPLFILHLSCGWPSVKCAGNDFSQEFSDHFVFMFTP